MWKILFAITFASLGLFGCNKKSRIVVTPPQQPQHESVFARTETPVPAEPPPGLIKEDNPSADVDYRRECGISWDNLRLVGAEGFGIQEGPDKHMVIGADRFMKLKPNSLPLRIGLQRGDEILNINGEKDFKHLPLTNYFANFQKHNYMIFKRKGEIKMIKFTCPP